MPLKVKFDQGNNTAADPSMLRPGEMVQSTGGHYKDSDNRLHKIGGVTAFADTGTSKKVDGVALLQFDDGADKIVALSDRTLWGSDISSKGASGSFSSLQSGLATGTDSLRAAHFNDRQYLALGTKNLVVESDGTTRNMGMYAPGPISAAASAESSTNTRPSSVSGSAYENQAQAYDADKATYASLRDNAANSYSTTFAFSGTSDTGTGRFLKVRWAVGASMFTDEITGEAAYNDSGGGASSSFVVDVKVEVSEDGGSNWTDLVYRQNLAGPVGTNDSTVGITDALELDGNYLVRVTFTYKSGTNYAEMRVYDIVAESGSSTTNFSTTRGGFWYAVTEYDGDRGLESTARPISAVIELVTQNAVTITLPTSATNSSATHYNIYRTTDGGDKQASLGKIGEAALTDTTFVDTFETYSATDNDLAYPLYPLLRVVLQQDTGSDSPLYFEQTNPAPACRVFRTFEGSIVGFPSGDRRSMVYSMAGYPEYFPKINVISSFPFEEHDRLVDGVSLGSVFLIAAEGLMMRLTSLPRAVNSILDSSRVEQIKGAPGCVGIYALTAYSVQGEPRAAWISPYGIYITNGDKIDEISSEQDWGQFNGLDKSRWGLHWDANRLCLVFSYSTTGGENDRYQLLHMAPDHKKASGQPKWTGPHYGSFASLDSGQVDSTHRLYGGHSSDGTVYVLDNGTTDASGAYSGTTVPLIPKTGKVYASDGEDEWAALDGVLYHTNFGGGETCKIEWEVGNDLESGGSHTHTIPSVSLSGHKGTQLDISQRCQWAQATLTHTGQGSGAIRDLAVRVKGRGERGNKRVA